MEGNCSTCRNTQTVLVLLAPPINHTHYRDQSTGKKLIRAPVVCVGAPATTEMVGSISCHDHIFAGTGSSGPPPSILDSIFGGHWTSLLDELSLLSLSS